MAAYAAVNSLLKTINQISDCFSLDPLSRKIIKPVKKKLESLLVTLTRLEKTRKSKSRKKINDVDGRIKEAVRRFEDQLESRLGDEILPQIEAHQYLLTTRREALFHSQINLSTMFFSVDLQGLKHDVDSFVLEVKSMEKDYVQELIDLPEEEEEEERIGFVGTKLKMVGLSDQFESARDVLIQNHGGNHLYCLFGMAGIGKTTLAEKLFEDPKIRSHFEHRVWVNVGRRSRTKEYYARAILSQMDRTNGEEGQGDIVKYLKKRLVDKKCLVVLDDVWENEELDLVVSTLPEERGITQILLTGRRQLSLHRYFGSSYEVVRFMNEDEGLDLLCKKVFGEEGSLPSRLEEAAKKIVKICEGLPLLILAVADRLSSKGDMTEEYWNEVAEKRNSVFMDALDEISKVLFPSYDYLHQELKMLFLYLGVFPPDCDISPSKLTGQLAGEGWICSTYVRESFETRVLEYLDRLCLLHYLVLYKKKSMYWHKEINNMAIKTCRLHCSWRHLCQVEARKIKFYQILNRWVDAWEEVIKGQRGLCHHNNILFAIEDVHDSVKRNCASSVRSLLCFGPYHQYPIPIDVGFKLLRELNALNLRFYTFPTEILELIHLKYLALTCNGEIPPTISKLILLQVFIVHPHTNIIIRGVPSYLPIQLLDMRHLEHIEILGKSLRVPYEANLWRRLTTFLGVSPRISELLNVSEKLQELRKLEIQIELKPYDDNIDLLNCFLLISELRKLKILKCNIANSHIIYEYLSPPIVNLSKFPYATLQKLHLSGMGFSWKFMDTFGLLPNLEVLKLRCYACRGRKWNAKEDCCKSLQFLLIEDSDLEQWTPGRGCFPKLSYLSMKHCYKLRELHWPSASYKKEIKIELVDCNPLAVTCAKQIQLPKGRALNLIVTSSYGGHNENIKLAW